MTSDGRAARALSVAALVALAACAAPDGAAPVAATPPEPKTEAAPETAPESARLPEPAAVIPVPAEPEPESPAPDELIGQRDAELNQALGQASLVRRDLGAEVWQYRTDECVLFLFLYPSDDAVRVRHLEVRGSLDAPACVKSVVRARLRTHAG